MRLFVSTRRSRPAMPERSIIEKEFSEAKSQRKMAVRELYWTPEFGLASAIAFGWCVALIPFVGLASFIALFFAFGIVEGMLLLAISLGSYGFVYSSAIYLLVVATSAVLARGWNRPFGLVLAASSALLLMDATRLSFGRRRGSALPGSAVISTYASTALVTVLSLFSAGVMTTLTGQPGQRNWIWVPVVSGVILVLTAALTFALSHSPARSATKRWKPGQTMVPPPVVD